MPGSDVYWGLYAARRKSEFAPDRVSRRDVELVVRRLLADLDRHAADGPSVRSALIENAQEDIWDLILIAYNDGLGGD